MKNTARGGLSHQSAIVRGRQALLLAALIGLGGLILILTSGSPSVVAEDPSPALVFAYVANPPTSCEPPTTNFPTRNVEFSSANLPVTTINGDLRTNGSIYAGALTVNGTVTFGCQIGPIDACHAVCDPAVQDTSLAPYPVPLTDADFPCGTDQPNVFNMSSGILTTATDQNGINHFHVGDASHRNTLDPGIYCVDGPITIPNRTCARLTSGDSLTCYIPEPRGARAEAGEGVTFVALGSTGYVQGGTGSACLSIGLCSELPSFSSASLNPHNVLVYASASGGGLNGSAFHPTCGTNGVRNLYTGLIATPNGMINGAGLCTFWGGWESDTIKVTGGGIIINPFVDAADNCPSVTNPGQENADGDAWGDACDNCPLTATTWNVPAGDTDCDYWTDTAEGAIGTDPAQECDDGAGLPDWPPDFNNDKAVDILDVLQFKPILGLPSARHDLNVSGGDIDILDVLAVKPVFSANCN